LRIRKTLRACMSLFRIRAVESMQYRAAALVNSSVGIFWAFIEITVFTIFYTYGNNQGNAALTLPQVVSYSWLGQMLFGMMNLDVDGELRGKINSGDVGVELCRPMSFYAFWFTKTASNRLGGGIWRMVATLAAGIIAPAAYRLSPPASVAGLALFLLSVSSAFFLCGAYSMLLTAVRLGITWGEGPTYMLGLLGMVLGGGYLPLQLWPDLLQKILLFQPFAGYIDIPVRL